MAVRASIGVGDGDFEAYRSCICWSPCRRPCRSPRAGLFTSRATAGGRARRRPRRWKRPAPPAPSHRRATTRPPLSSGPAARGLVSTRMLRAGRVRTCGPRRWPDRDPAAFGVLAVERVHGLGVRVCVVGSGDAAERGDDGVVDAARPSRVPATMSSRMNSASAAKTWNTSRPPGGRGIQGLVQQGEPGPAAAQVRDGGDQVLQRAGEPVQGGHHQVSPGCRNSSAARSSARSVSLPDCLSAKIRRRSAGSRSRVVSVLAGFAVRAGPFGINRQVSDVCHVSPLR